MRLIFLIDPGLNSAGLPFMKPPVVKERNAHAHLHKLLLNELHALLTNRNRDAFKLDVILEVYELDAAGLFLYLFGPLNILFTLARSQMQGGLGPLDLALERGL